MAGLQKVLWIASLMHPGPQPRQHRRLLQPRQLQAITGRGIWSGQGLWHRPRLWPSWVTAENRKRLRQGLQRRDLNLQVREVFAVKVVAKDLPNSTHGKWMLEDKQFCLKVQKIFKRISKVAKMTWHGFWDPPFQTSWGRERVSEAVPNHQWRERSLLDLK